MDEAEYLVNMSRDERYQKSHKVNLQVIFKNGKLYLVEDNTELIIANDSIFEIIIHKKYILNRRLQPQLTQGKIQKLLSKGETLLVELFPNHLDKNTQPCPYSFNKELGKSVVKITLSEDLNLEIKNYDKSRLKSCKCFIPFLKTEAGSLNQAYSLISTNLEKTRKSHSGNVFNLIYYKTDKDKMNKLENLRKKAICEFQSTILQ